ncbi:AfsR/SARP family transcriptional regulator [Sinosporangium siamense]|uniref:SARP family transcriptional regulator n=1 Tax=Sinosporangium siamense TaxID=1367973 RepID=A0A919RRT7_9ACTN|nr:BTAD domain-containing putative transcriptional regulator [Sinosporangium siamense]GII97574.1 SARP family transcriptional regulator [Sinosporangium siamense]
MDWASVHSETCFSVLGSLDVRRGGEPVEVGGRRLRALLTILLLDAGETVPLTSLIEGVWGGNPPANAGNALQALISRLRNTFAAPGPAGHRKSASKLIVGEPSGYRLAVAPEQVDLHRFARLTADGSRALAGGDPARAFETLGRALALWRGPALPDLAGGDFAATELAHLDALRLAAEENRAEAALRLGRPGETLADLRRLTATHPLHEPLRAQLMRALYGMGRHVEALAAYEEARADFADRLGADPSPRLSTLHVAMLRGEWHEHNSLTGDGVGDGRGEPGGDVDRASSANGGVPAGSTAEATPVQGPAGGQVRRGNLRARLTSFVGRERDVTQVDRLLEGHRLVSLLGPGGAGKSSLAVRTAEVAADRMPGGVWMAELAGVPGSADVDEVAEALSAALGLRPVIIHSVLAGSELPRSCDALTRLVGGLAGRHLLIIVDNCEHVVESAAIVVDRLLAECPNVRVLATTREPLGITGEVLWPVTPLKVPPAGADPDTAMSASAVRLFADRAAAALPGFSVAGNIRAVARICRELDGMPLAIELAAARLRTLSPDALADRLDDRFRLLTGGSRTALPRHQTLHAVVEWSWALLDERERVLARRLSVFAGGATLAAAERVCAGEGLDPADVLDTLARLVDKSLVAAAVQSGEAEATRYTMLETVRAYAEERLTEAGERERVRLAHARHFLGVAEEAEPRLRGRGQLDTLRLLSAEHDNTSAALRRAIDSGEGEVALRLVGALGWYWCLAGHRREAFARSEEALRVGAGAAPELRLAAWTVCGTSFRDTDMTAEAVGDAIREIQELNAALDGPPGVQAALAEATWMLLAGDMHANPSRLDRLIVWPDPWVRAWASTLKGMFMLAAGDIVACEESLLAAHAGFERLGDRWGVSTCLSALAELSHAQNRPAESVDRARAAIAAIEEFGGLEETHSLLLFTRLATSLWHNGERDAARELLSQTVHAIRVGEREREGAAAALVFAIRGDFAREEGELAGAERHYAEALLCLENSPLGAEEARTWINTSLAMLAEQRGDVARAGLLLGEALRCPRDGENRPVLSLVLIGYAVLALAGGEPERAAVLLGGAVGVRGFDTVVDYDHVRADRGARAALGPEEFTRCLERGRALTREEVVALLG